MADVIEIYDIIIDDTIVLPFRVGVDGHSPYIGENGNWYQWSHTEEDYVDTGVVADANLAVSNHNDSLLAHSSLFGNKEDATNKSTNIETDALSVVKYPSVKVIKDYVDGLVVGLLDDRGSYDASSNVFPTTGGSGTAGAILKGDIWYISAEGTLGGTLVKPGYSVRALTDTPGQTATNWGIMNIGIGYVPENESNKVTSLSAASTDTQYPSARLTYNQLALKANLSGGNTFLGNQTFDTNTLFVDTVNHRVGVGTILPAYKLDVAGTFKAGIPQVGSTGTGTGTISNWGMDEIVTGYGTLFMTELTAGMFIRDENGAESQIASITSNTQLTLTEIPQGFLGAFTYRTADYVVHSSLIFNDSLLISGVDGATPVSGAGTRLMWIPAKKAFRAGAVTGTEWDNASIGLYSVAMGLNSVASANYSTALGNHTLANTENSFAVGAYNVGGGLIKFSVGTGSSYGGRKNAFTVLATSKVGINTASPTFDLSFGSYQNDTTAKKIGVENSLGNYAGIQLTVAAGSAVSGTNIVGGNLILQSGLGTGTGASTISFQTGTTLTTGTVLQTMSTKMTILGNGNVGIGIITPSYLLDVQGNAELLFNLTRIGTATGAVSQRFVNSGGNYYIGVESSVGNRLTTNGQAYALVFNTESARPIQFGTNNNARVIIDSDGKVGIGTLTPAVTLDVVGHIKASSNVYSGGASGFVFGASASEGEYIYRSGNNIIVRAGDTDQMTILGTGGVGIGTTTPTSKLEVYGNSDQISAVGDTSTAQAAGILWKTGGVGSSHRNWAWRTDQYAVGDFALRVSSAFNTSPSVSVMQITKEGNIGIGTTNPLSTLHVVGSARVVNTAMPVFTVSGASNSTTLVGDSPAIHIINSNSTDNNFANIWFSDNGSAAVAIVGSQITDHTNKYGNLQFYTKGAAGAGVRMIITPDGNVGIGTTTPSAQFDLFKDNWRKFSISYPSSYAVRLNIGVNGYVEQDANGGSLTIAQLYSDASSNIKFILGTERVRINYLGYVGIGTTTPGTALTFGGTDPTISTDTSDGSDGKRLILTGGGGVGHLRGATIYLRGNEYSSAGTLELLAGNTGNIDFYTGDSVNRLRVTSTGNVGIGTTSPSGIIHAKTIGSSSTTSIFEMGGMTTDVQVPTIRALATKTTDMADGFGSQIGFYIQDDASGICTLGFVGAVRSGNDNSGDLTFSVRKLGSTNESVRITKNGDVGVNTISPESKLHVNGAIQIANDTAAASSNKVGAIRYRISGNASLCEMCMQTGASAYEWKTIATYTW